MDTVTMLNELYSQIVSIREDVVLATRSDSDSICCPCCKQPKSQKMCSCQTPVARERRPAQVQFRGWQKDAARELRGRSNIVFDYVQD